MLLVRISGEGISSTDQVRNYSESDSLDPFFSVVFFNITPAKYIHLFYDLLQPAIYIHLLNISISFSFDDYSSRALDAHGTST